MLWQRDSKGKQVNTGLSKFIREKILRGWPNTPLLNHDKTYCQVPKEEQLTKWIDEYNDDFAHTLFNEIVKHQSDRQVKRTRPMQYPSGLYFNVEDVKKWLKKAKKSEKK